MNSTIIAVLLLITFALFIGYILKGGNLMIGFFVMAILWAIIGMVPFDTAIQKIFAEPATNYGPTIIYIVFGSWFGRVLVDSGIAPAISETTNKVGRKKPLLAAVLVLIVTAFIFVSAYGVGSVIAIGVILLPIMLSVGVPRDIALVAFSMAIGAPMYINVVLYNQIKVFFPKAAYNASYLHFGIIAMAVQLIAVILFLFIVRKKIDPSKAELNLNTIGAGMGDEKEVKSVPKIAFVIPIVPVLMNMLFHWDAVPALTLATLLGALLTGNMKNYKHFVNFMNETVKHAIADIAGLVMFLMSLAMFTGAASLNAARFKPIFEAILPNSHLILALALGILAPLALFRGPLHVWGAGAATAAVLSGTGLFSDVFLLPLLYVPTLMAVSVDITQSWNVWGLDYMKVQSKDFLKYGVPVMWIVSIINEFLVFKFFG
ncbi:gluconate:proton symporter [Lactiplantibacillus pentosus]|uniref:Gluconate:proton symporter n=1 Tax=Lactiplantibacillus pentosus TaxID=1589 RepID=A0AB37RE93_LACPE|nr:gluconate:proton symporter [Lactiplantibacillus pentosus]RMW42408.1 gluconate:proton symporter [Lactiplantibacillus pentosus]RMW48422.1 gluconate:proton symporter [Lactiplantibacillus pentosus]RMW52559.1 gluconate:proton symporter [Lactiplantibacillus pentosus]RMW55293.1 gluconate:proton symporter [Lactiplantibacillus pentosus]